MEESATYFMEKAAQCRRLANGLPNYNVNARKALIALAEEFEAKAEAVLARTNATEENGIGDEIAPMIGNVAADANVDPNDRKPASVSGTIRR
jgi:hypothetical protein